MTPYIYRVAKKADCFSVMFTLGGEEKEDSEGDK